MVTVEWDGGFADPFMFDELREEPAFLTMNGPKNVDSMIAFGMAGKYRLSDLVWLEAQDD